MYSRKLYVANSLRMLFIASQSLLNHPIAAFIGYLLAGARACTTLRAHLDTG
jgi:hypothetical protein